MLVFAYWQAAISSRDSERQGVWLCLGLWQRVHCNTYVHLNRTRVFDKYVIRKRSVQGFRFSHLLFLSTLMLKLKPESHFPPVQAELSIQATYKHMFSGCGLLFWLTHCLGVCVCLCYRNILRRSASLRSVCLRTIMSHTPRSCTVRRSRVGPGTLALTETDRSWKEIGSKRLKEQPTSCPSL